MVKVYIPFFFLAMPALLMAIAMACFWGRPSFIILEMLENIAFLDEPFLSGMITYRISFSSSSVLQAFGYKPIRH